MKQKLKKLKKLCLFLPVFLLLFQTSAYAVTTTQKPGISVNINGSDVAGSSNSLQLLFLITVLALVPSLLIMMTGFTRIVIVLSFVRNALGLQQTPPNQVLIGLSIFLTFFVMSPIINQINTEAYTPFTKGQITQQQAIDKAMVPVKQFMLKQTKDSDLKMFLRLSKIKAPESVDKIPTEVVVPAFITSELRRAFIMGFLIFLPFLIIDMVVSSVLMSMGMVMLPPVMISLPFKIILFVLVDGWALIIKTLITSFN
ncbi:MAG: flagellar biosynthetic protein FliP [Clostridiales bacterium 43-6]|nr:MAG: flagellar biosynthetic protein FliP [Clostridiales bacterium 43-6]